MIRVDFDPYSDDDPTDHKIKYCGLIYISQYLDSLTWIRTEFLCHKYSGVIIELRAAIKYVESS